MRPSGRGGSAGGGRARTGRGATPDFRRCSRAASPAPRSRLVVMQEQRRVVIGDADLADRLGLGGDLRPQTDAVEHQPRAVGDRRGAAVEPVIQHRAGSCGSTIATCSPAPAQATPSSRPLSPAPAITSSASSAISAPFAGLAASRVTNRQPASERSCAHVGHRLILRRSAANACLRLLPRRRRKRPAGFAARKTAFGRHCTISAANSMRSIGRVGRSTCSISTCAMRTGSSMTVSATPSPAPR